MENKQRQKEERGESVWFSRQDGCFLEDFDCSTVIAVRGSRLKKKLCSVFVLPIWRSCLPPAVYTLRKKASIFHRKHDGKRREDDGSVEQRGGK